MMNKIDKTLKAEEKSIKIQELIKFSSPKLKK